MTRRAQAWPALYSAGLAHVILAPLLAPGYLLLRDAVSTPRSYLTDAALGIGDAAPRAVPQDAIVAVASMAIDGGIVVKVVLLLALSLAGWGAAALAGTLAPELGLIPRLVAATVAIWNPYVAERLLQGHWSLLVGYAALPWVARAGVLLRDDGGWARLAVPLAVAGITPTGAILAVLVALVSVPARQIAGVLLVGVAVSAPWLVGAWQSGAGAASDPAGVAAFAARAEPGLGTLGSVAGLGGIWNSAAVPDSRSGLFALVGTILLLAVVAAGAGALWRRQRALVLLAVGSIVLVALAATPVGIVVGEWAVVHLPGAGLLRDSQKWVALALPGFAVAAALGSARVRFPAVAIVLVVVALPDLAWGVGGAVQPVRYPDSWAAVAAVVGDDPGDVAVLPAGMFRQFPYGGRAPVLDPAPRMLPADVLQTGELVVAGGTVRGEGTRAEDVEALLLAGADAEAIADQGVRWILVEKTSPGPRGESAATLAQLSRRFSDAELDLYEVPGVAARDSRSRVPALLAHGMWLVVLVGAAVVCVGRRRPPRGRLAMRFRRGSAG